MYSVICPHMHLFRILLSSLNRLQSLVFYVTNIFFLALSDAIICLLRKYHYRNKIQIVMACEFLSRPNGNTTVGCIECVKPIMPVMT